ncbi:hypothetical protein C4840_25515, partial [Salmonella enterica subsp. enterica serovar Braenderup]
IINNKLTFARFGAGSLLEFTGAGKNITTKVTNVLSSEEDKLRIYIKSYSIIPFSFRISS